MLCSLYICERYNIYIYSTHGHQFISFLDTWNQDFINIVSRDLGYVADYFKYLCVIDRFVTFKCQFYFRVTALLIYANWRYAIG